MDERHDLRKDAGTGFPLHKMLDVIQQIHERERVILHLDAQIDLHLRIGVQPGEKPMIDRIRQHLIQFDLQLQHIALPMIDRPHGKGTALQPGTALCIQLQPADKIDDLQFHEHPSFQVRTSYHFSHPKKSVCDENHIRRFSERYPRRSS